MMPTLDARHHAPSAPTLPSSRPLVLGLGGAALVGYEADASAPRRRNGRRSRCWNLLRLAAIQRYRCDLAGRRRNSTGQHRDGGERSAAGRWRRRSARRGPGNPATATGTGATTAQGRGAKARAASGAASCRPGCRYSAARSWRSGTRLRAVVVLPRRTARRHRLSVRGGARYEVTRGEYAAFALATGRAASEMPRTPHSPLSALLKLIWREPGFDQNVSHPVVCVTWTDANAYRRGGSARRDARKLSPCNTSRAEVVARNTVEYQQSRRLRAGQRLAEDKRAPFHHAARRRHAPTVSPSPRRSARFQAEPDRHSTTSSAMSANGCATASRHAPARARRQCLLRERLFSGTSWRESATDQRIDFVDDAGVDVVYTTIGIRLLREFDGDQDSRRSSNDARPLSAIHGLCRGHQGILPGAIRLLQARYDVAARSQN